jgi:hypothetical protein
MSLPRANYDPRRVCLNPFPDFTLGIHRRSMGVYLAGGLVRLQHIYSLLIAKPFYSLLLLIGRFWMLPFSLSMLKHLSERLQALTRRCTSPFSIGFLAYVRCLDTWLSTSSTRIGFVGTKASETREQCGELDCSCSSDSL